MSIIFRSIFLLPILFISISGCTDSIESAYSKKQSASGGPPVTRSQVILTADKYARVHWVMADANLSGAGCGGYFKSDYSTGPRIGMGYKFGGWDSIDTFLKRIAEGYGTGTGVEDYKEVPFGCVTGISCTGLVSRAWHLDQKYTLVYPDQPNVPRQLNEITNLADAGNSLLENTVNLKKGDALINNSHVMIFLYENRGGNSMIIHSTAGGVRFEEKSWLGLWLQRYIPIKYNNIVEEDNPPGTASNPIIVDLPTLSYTHEGNTRNIISMEFDKYSAAPEKDQEGPEKIYKFSLGSNKTAVIQINDLKSEGIDNDIHLLNSLKKSSSN